MTPMQAISRYYRGEPLIFGSGASDPVTPEMAEDYRKAAEWNAREGNFDAVLEYTKLYGMHAAVPDSELDIPMSVEQCDSDCPCTGRDYVPPEQRCPIAQAIIANGLPKVAK